jgi:hypothetical protein
MEISMIDNELDQLSRALIAATDRLNSQDFKDRQAKYVQMEQEFLTLGNELEAEEVAVERAQHALTQHIARNYLEGADLNEPAAEEELFGTDPHFAVLDAPDPASVADEERQEGWDKYFRQAGYKPYEPETDEFSTPRANGAYTD